MVDMNGNRPGGLDFGAHEADDGAEIDYAIDAVTHGLHGGLLCCSGRKKARRALAKQRRDNARLDQGRRSVQLER